MPATELTAILELTIWRDGALVGSEEPQVSVWDHGILYGDGVFDGLRLRSGRLYRAADHLARLERSARLLGLRLPYPADELRAAISAVTEANRLREAHVRIIVTRGIGLPGLDPARCPRSSVFVMASPMPSLMDGPALSLITSAFTRKAPRSAPAAAKTLNYLDGILAKQQASHAGASDALMLDASGCVAEATAANIFLVRDGALTTPICTAALPGITRAVVFELAAELGISADESTLTLGDVYAADEIFLTGTAAGIASVGAVDGRSPAAADGPVTAAIIEAYRATWTDSRHSEAL